MAIAETIKIEVGYESLKDCINDTVKQYIAFYGKGLKSGGITNDYRRLRWL